MSAPLVRWLGGRTADELAAILTRRPDVLTGPAVDTLGALAGRLQARDSVAAALAALPRPAIQLIEVIQALGGPAVARDRVAATVGRPPDDPELAATLTVLAGRALVWPAGDGLRMAAPLWSAFARPLGLGERAERLLDGRSAAELGEIADALGLARRRSRQERLAAIVAALADGPAVRALVAAAPSDARTMLADLARTGALLLVPAGERRGRAGAALGWALRHGLLVWDGWRHAQLPAEVGMALRGPDWHAPFDPLPPRPDLVEADPAAVSMQAAAAALSTVEQVTALLDTVAATPVAVLKAGGVGSRELRRLSRSVGCGEPETRLWLELAHAAGLVGVVSGEVRPTEAYDGWGGAGPAGRLVTLLRAWPRLPAAPLADQRPDDARPVAALLRDGTALAAAELRPALLHCAADLPANRGVADPDGLVRTLCWRLPMVAGPEPSGGTSLPASLCREARLVGALAHGALTPLGRALLDEPATLAGSLADAAERLLPGAVGSAVFQNDLTAVVPGIPTGALATLLDAGAERESRGGATTWRFSPASVRSALDAGADPDEFLAGLRAVAVGGTLPQVLEYLVADVGRRHGRIRVRNVGCVLRADDPALVAEIARARALRPLGLSVLAPTVLASVKPVAETLRALRAAGYAPVAEDSGGEPRIERAPRRRAPAPRRSGHGPGRGRAGAAGPDAGTGAGRCGDAGRADPDELAARLLARAAVAPDPEPEPALAQVIALPVAAAGRIGGAVREYCDGLDAEQQRILATAIDGGIPVKIDYRDSAGDFSTRVIEPVELDRHLLTAWCHLRDDERMFALDRIEAVSPG